MSFSNTDTGSKPADPYTAKNKDETSVKEKVEDLNAFIDASKFGMMTTKDNDGKLVSRCMAVAGKVDSRIIKCLSSYINPRRKMELISSSTQTPNPERRTIFKQTTKSTFHS